MTVKDSNRYEVPDPFQQMREPKYNGQVEVRDK